MNEDLNVLLEEISSKMEKRLVERDFDSVRQLSILIGKAQELQSRAREINVEIARIRSELLEASPTSSPPPNAPTPPTPAQIYVPMRSSLFSKQQKLRIVINWKLLGRQAEPETIEESKSGDTMVKFFYRLIFELGQDKLQQLTQIRIHRGPLLSKNPERDFAFGHEGKTYNHQPLPKTDYYVLTHSGTPEKAEELRRICQQLELRVGAVTITTFRPPSLVAKYIED